MPASTHQTENCFIDGPSGQLEAMISRPSGEATACGIICHPHPQHAGTMHNKVVTTLNWAMEAMGWVTVRFNYRGVGKSAGEYDNQIGEVEDARAVYQWLQAHYPHLPIHLAGFSFGAYISAKLASQLPAASLVSAAPVVSYSTYSDLAPISCPWFAIVGEADELVSVDEIENYRQESGQQFELHSFPETSHFFHGQLIPLREAVKAFYTNY